MTDEETAEIRQEIVNLEIRHERATHECRYLEGQIFQLKQNGCAGLIRILSGLRIVSKDLAEFLLTQDVAPCPVKRNILHRAWQDKNIKITG